MTAVDERRRPAWGFAAAVFVSAFLLFQVQPLISKAILPWFGGTPAVWTTCMLFFQVVLFAGYAYAHLISSRMPPRVQVVLHMALIAAALLLLHILPGADWKPTGRESPTLRIVQLLLATVGLPYFILSTTGPLLQRWFSLAHPGRSPYWLYALSNAGSLLALLSYPFAFEPSLAMSSQGRFWSIGFWVFAALCAACALRLFRLPAVAPAPTAATPWQSQAPPGGGRYAVWFSLAMVGSAMLLAITNQVCQDVAVIPFLWVVPLSLYLLTFILCFDSDRWYSRRVYALSSAALVVAVCWMLVYGLMTFLPLQALVYFGALFAVCMLCHGELARMRPDPRHLTAFYLTISAGGAGGGLFVGLLAPHIFPDYWELHACLAAACLIAILVYFHEKNWFGADVRPPMIWSLGAILLISLIGTVIADEMTEHARVTDVRRNFYGVLKVEDELQVLRRAGQPPLKEPATVLRHGRIIHGLQYQDPALASEPTTYYARTSGVGLALATLAERPEPIRVGVVGLGAGTLAAYARHGDVYRFYEINDAVIDLATRHFSFLSASPGEVENILGDARLSLEAEPPQDYDLLVLDAFSGDAIPTHLLTREAMQQYLRHVRPDGIIAIHVSNLHFDLRPVVAALADEFDLSLATVDDQTERLAGDRTSRWMLLSRNPSVLKSERIAAQTSAPQDLRVLWTDEFSNLITLMPRVLQLRQWWRRVWN
jgi:SAM-dependent methyltransferase